MQLLINEWSSPLQYRILADICGHSSSGQQPRIFHSYTLYKAFHKPN